MHTTLLRSFLHIEGDAPGLSAMDQNGKNGKNGRAADPITHVSMGDIKAGDTACILLPVANPYSAAGLARLAAQLAASCTATVVVLHLLRPSTQSEAALEAPVSPDAFEAVAIALETLEAAGARAGWIVGICENEGAAIRHVTRMVKAELVILGWHGGKAPSEETVGDAALTDVLTDPVSDIAVLSGEPPADIRRVLAPVGAGPHSALALRTAMRLVTNGEGTHPKKPGSVTALHIKTTEGIKVSDIHSAQVYVDEYEDDPHLKLRVTNGKDVAAGILAEASTGYDLIIMGTSQEALIDRMLFGEIPERVAQQSETPLMVMRRHTEPVTRVVRGAWHGIAANLPRPSADERAEVLAEVWRGSNPRIDFYVMMTLAALIAAFGLLLDSPAVVIGAMLIAPLMTAIVGIGLGIVEGDNSLLKSALLTSAIGVILSVFAGFLIGILMPGARETSEIMARAAAGVLDLGVALASGAAVAYVMSRKVLSSALAGVSISAALVPPLATAGIALGLFDVGVAAGALLLFTTNLIAIAGAAALVFLLLGFAPPPGEKSRRLVLQRGVFGTLIILGLITLILGVLTANSLQAAQLNAKIEDAVVAELKRFPNTTLDEVAYTLGEDNTVELQVSVLSNHDFSDEDLKMFQIDVAETLARPVSLLLTVIPATQLDPLVPRNIVVTATPTG